MEAITGELDWFVENGKVDILNERWHTVDVAGIPPYKWNAEKPVELRLIDLCIEGGWISAKAETCKAEGRRKD